MIRYYVFTNPPEYTVEAPEGMFRVIDATGFLEAEYVNEKGDWVKDPSLLDDVSGQSGETGVEEVSEAKAREILEGWDFVEDADGLLRR